MFDLVMEAAKRCVAVSSLDYLRAPVDAFKREHAAGARGPIFLAVYSVFENELKARLADAYA